MGYKPIDVDYERLTIMGVPFPDRDTLEAADAGIGTNMFEGYLPTMEGILQIRDLLTGAISIKEMIALSIEEDDGCQQ